MRVATIDIGTNTTLLLVAERTAAGDLRAVREIATITRLGQGVDQTRQLAPEAVARTLACLEGYADVVKELGVSKTGIVGTSAMRDAGGSEVMRSRVAGLFGVEPEVITGVREAELTGRGALSGLGWVGPAMVFDIGGGSTEAIALDQDRRVADRVSVDVGSVRLTERVRLTDPPTASELAAMREAARAALAPLTGIAGIYAGLGGREPPVGVAGTMTTLAAVAMELATYDGAKVHGSALSKGAIEEVVARLAAMPLERRASVAGLDPKRADVIVAGGSVALACLDAMGAERVVVSDRGVRWGLAEELARG